MAEKTLHTVIQVRRDTTENWLLNKNVIPAAGEPCMDLDTGEVRWGNGVDAYESLHASGGTVVEELETLVSGLETDVETVQDSIATLTGTGEGSIEKTVADAVAAIVAGADASYDSLKEIADWIMSDTTGAAKMQSDIVTNTTAIEALEALVGDTDVASQIAAALEEALKSDGTSKYALASELETLQEVVDGIADGEANVIEIIKLNGTAVDIVDKTVDIQLPAATAATLGLVKSSTEENEIAVADDGTMSVNSVNINKLVQTEGDTLILDGGNSGE